MEAGNGPSSGEYSLLTLFVDPQLFITTSVTKYLWGYVDPLTDACNALDSQKCPSAVVGLMFGVSLETVLLHYPLGLGLLC